MGPADGQYFGREGARRHARPLIAPWEAALEDAFRGDLVHAHDGDLADGLAGADPQNPPARPAHDARRRSKRGSPRDGGKRGQRRDSCRGRDLVQGPHLHPDSFSVTALRPAPRPPGGSSGASRSTTVDMPLTTPPTGLPNIPISTTSSCGYRRHGQVVDKVDGYFGLRRSTRRTAVSIRTTGPLHETCPGPRLWPDGILTAPTDRRLSGNRARQGHGLQRSPQAPEGGGSPLSLLGGKVRLFGLGRDGQRLPIFAGDAVKITRRVDQQSGGTTTTLRSSVGCRSTRAGA